MQNALSLCREERFFVSYCFFHQPGARVSQIIFAISRVLIVWHIWETRPVIDKNHRMTRYLRSGLIFSTAFWYILTSTPVVFLLEDVIAPVWSSETPAAPDCASMGCGCDMSSPDHICCCTGQKVGVVHKEYFNTQKSDQSAPLSLFAAAYCAGGFPDQDTLKPAPSQHVLANALLCVPALCLLFLLPTRAIHLSDRREAPPDKDPILFLS